MKTILITGGSDGLGKALAEKLASDNNVIILARNEAAMQKIAAETGCSYYVCDVRDAKQIAVRSVKSAKNAQDQCAH